MASNIKIIDLFLVLTNDEVIDFQNFIQSSFFHKSTVQEELKALLDYLIELKQGTAQGKEIVFDRENAFKRVYPNQVFVEKKIEKALSALHLSLKNFTAFNIYNHKDHQIDRQIKQLTFLRDRQLHNRYKNLSKSIMDELNAVERKGIQSLKINFELNYELYIYESQYNIKSAHLMFQSVAESLEVSYLAHKIELLNQYLTVSYFSSVPIPEEIEQMIQNSTFPEKIIEKNPLLFLMYKIFLLLKEKEVTINDISYLNNLFLGLEAKISTVRIRQFLTLLRNVCLLASLKKRQEFLPLLFVLFKEHYEKGYLHYDGFITASAFTSVINTALVNKEYDWCETFIRQQKGKILNDTPSDDFYHLGLANFYTFTNQFEEALSTVPASLPTTDALLMAKRIELKCYYETKSSLLDSKIDAFRMYLSRISKNLVSEQLHQSNSNFLNILNQIHSSIPGDKKRNLKILDRIEEKAYLFEREWLIEKTQTR